MDKKNIIIFLIIIILLLVSIVIINKIDRGGEETNTKGLKEVNLYFSTSSAMYLEAESREVSSNDLLLNTLKELIRGPETSSLNKTIPDGVKVLNIEVKKEIARINFNQALRENHWGGSTGERMTIYSIVNTMTQFDSIEKVQILIDGKEIKTLVGHLDLTEPLGENENLYK